MTVASADITQLDALITPECREAIRREIESVHGAEVFFVGQLNQSLIVEEVEAYAFGNRRTVPALLQYAHPGDVILHNHPSGSLEPSSADIEISSTLGERGIGSYIVNNDCTEIRLVVKAMRPQGVAALDGEALVRMISPGGLLSEALEGFEFRPQQVEMLRAVTRALNEDAITVVEAGTGTGKSMAYLLPAIAWGLKNKEKVVVSTHTINLQEQLIEKDLPLLRQALGLEFDAVLVKGRGNYLCKRKAEYVRTNPEYFVEPEKRLQLDAIQEWIKTTREGSLSDLSFTPDSDVWEKFISESDNCLRTKCPFYQNCFFYTARRQAARAQVLVANHHLLMADLAVRAETNNYTQAAVLPPFHRVIFDEAHHLEDVATAYFGARVTRSGVTYLLSKLATPRTGKGLLNLLSGKIQDGTYPLPGDEANRWSIRLSLEIAEKHRDLRDAIEEAADRAAMALDELHGGNLSKSIELKKRITREIEESDFWNKDVAPGLARALEAGRHYIEALRGLHGALYETVAQETPELMSPILELRSTIMKIENFLSQLVRFVSGTDTDCRWIEYRRRGTAKRPMLAWCVAPLRIADDLRERVLRRFKSVILTSATLAVGRKFDHYLGQIGAEDPKRLSLITAAALEPAAPAAQRSRPRKLETLLLDAPFDYDAQVYVGVPIDMPAPVEAKFNQTLPEFVKRSLLISRGRGLVLFTSYSMLEQTYERIAPELEAAGYACLKQGTLGRTFLTESFRRDVGSVLFATSSFWEGVDVPGEALSCLLLTRLPFSVPGEPILEARIEAIKNEGKDPFETFVVPRAVIRFRQGFGRLIRTKEDRGAVLICDKRVASAGYGQIFLKSLPTRKVHVAPMEEIHRRTMEFFAAGGDSV